MKMLSNRPYLLRAFYDWIVDSGCTPVLVANPNHPQCRIPEYCPHDDHEVVFNLSPSAIRELDISKRALQFQASFNGIASIIVIPIGAVMAIYADENNEGLYFDMNDEDSVNMHIEPAPHIQAEMPASLQSITDAKDEENGEDGSKGKQGKGKPFLKLV